MDRPCDVCGESYLAKRPNSRFCSAKCRQRARRAPDASADQSNLNVSGSLVDVVTVTLEQVGRLSTPVGVRALMLAQRMSAGTPESGASYAALDRQLGTVLSEALEGVATADPLEKLRDELAARRDRRSA